MAPASAYEGLSYNCQHWAMHVRNVYWHLYKARHPQRVR